MHIDGPGNGIRMSNLIARIVGVPAKVARHMRLLRTDPERFGRNLLQVTNPALYEERLVDIVNPSPMYVINEPRPSQGPVLNVLDSRWTVRGMTGGPNTVVNLVSRVAMTGIPVRLVSTVGGPTIGSEELHRHAASLVGRSDFAPIQTGSAADPENPLRVGPRDIFLATHWSTARQLSAVLPSLAIKKFFFMLQEFEPAFYPWSSNFALAIQTYGLDFIPIINQQFLADYLFSLPFGRLRDPEFRKSALVFEPAVDSSLFHPAPASPRNRPNRLLFYARPTNTRNMFGLGLQALKEASADPVFAGWEFLSLGSRDGVPDMALGGGRVLRRAPWLDYKGYADLLREGDLLLCPMLSPHTSYPVLEMAACGGIAVTNAFATKTAAALEAISPQIVPTEATIAGLRDGLVLAAGRIVSQARSEAPPIVNLPRAWGSTLTPIAARIGEICRDLANTA